MPAKKQKAQKPSPSKPGTPLEMGHLEAWRAVPGLVRKRTRSKITNAQLNDMAVLFWRHCYLKTMAGQKVYRFLTPESGTPESFTLTADSIIEDFFRPTTDPRSARQEAEWILRSLLEDPEGCARTILKIAEAIREASPEDILIADLFDIPGATDEKIAARLRESIAARLGKKGNVSHIDARWVADRRQRLGLKKDPGYRTNPRKKRQRKTSGTK